MSAAEKIREEIHTLIPPTIYFFVTLHIIALVRVLMLKGTGITLATSASVTLGALVLAKAVVLADLLPFINRYPDRPIAWNIAWKTFMYLIAASGLHYLERLVEFWRAAGGFVAGNGKMLAEMVWPHFWAVEIFIGLTILVYCAMTELARVLGADRVREMVIGPARG
ncbi:MAG: hypothetical protein ABL989_13255 [Gammaproteobacteria bacterium]